MSAETSTPVCDAFWHTCIVNNRVCMWVEWNAIIAVFVWCHESRQKCCQRQHIEIRLNTGEALLLFLFVALVLENNVWFLGACWLYLSNCQTPVIVFDNLSAGAKIIWSHLGVFLKVLRVFYPFHIILTSFWACASVAHWSLHAVSLL